MNTSQFLQEVAIIERYLYSLEPGLKKESFLVLIRQLVDNNKVERPVAQKILKLWKIRNGLMSRPILNEWVAPEDVELVTTIKQELGL